MNIVKEVKIGDKIRSYTYTGYNDCYKEGVVVSIDRGTFTAKTTKVAIDGVVFSINVDQTFVTDLPSWNSADNCCPWRIVYA